MSSHLSVEYVEKDFGNSVSVREGTYRGYRFQVVSTYDEDISEFRLLAYVTPPDGNEHNLTLSRLRGVSDANPGLVFAEGMKKAIEFIDRQLQPDHS